MKRSPKLCPVTQAATRLSTSLLALGIALGSNGEALRSQTTQSTRPEATKPKPNARSFYRESWAGVCDALHAAPESTTLLARFAGIPFCEIPLDDAQFAPILDTTDHARERFAQAAALQRCESPDDENSIECLGILQSAVLVAANGVSLCQSHPDRSLSDAITLMRCGDQLRKIEHRDGFHYGRVITTLGSIVLARTVDNLTTAPEHRAALQRAREHLDAHTSSQPSLRDRAEAALIYVTRIHPGPRAPTKDDAEQVRADLDIARRAHERRLELARELFAPFFRNELPSLTESKKIDRDMTQKLQATLMSDVTEPTIEQDIELGACWTFETLELRLAPEVERENRYRRALASCRRKLSALKTQQADK